MERIAVDSIATPEDRRSCRNPHHLLRRSLANWGFLRLCGSWRLGIGMSSLLGRGTMGWLVLLIWRVRASGCLFWRRGRVLGALARLKSRFPGVRMSPCAYLAGLLHPLVVEELGLPARGFRWTPAVNGLFVPFLDGSSIQLWDDDERCEAEVRRFAPGDVEGWKAMNSTLCRLRDALRPASGNGGPRDFWIGDAPTPDEIDERLGDDQEARHLLYDWSMAEFVEHYLRDARLQSAYLGQGVIGTNASPFDAGTASIRFHHASGRLGGMPGMWGYVAGGMGMVSFYIADAAQEAGAVIAAGVPVAAILPGEGVLLESGERIAARVVISNADPVRTLGMLGEGADAAWRDAH